MTIPDEFFIKAVVLVGTAIVLAITRALWAIDKWHKRHGPRVHVRGREVRR